MDVDAEVIISGAGPAGSIAAFHLASSGFRVLILEKEQFPRYKVCGAGLTFKVLAEIPYDITPVIETTIYSFRFSHHFKEVYTRHSDQPVMFCSDRSVLDAFMAGKASLAGATIIMGKRVNSLEDHPDHILVSTATRSYSGRLLIGADGASGITASFSGLRRNIEQGLAWEAELEADPADVDHFKQSVFLDWGSFPGGYGWVFPKKDHFSVGVGGPASLSRQMMPYYQYFIRSTGIRFGATRSLRSWPIPVRSRRSAFHRGKIMVAGDAGGLTDPLTGEGIWFAVISGRLAAEAAIEYLRGQRTDLSHYSAAVNNVLMPEILEANRIRYIFNAAPRKIHLLIMSQDRYWRAFGKILRGERKYADVQTGFGRYAFLWNLIVTISKLIYRWKERQARKQS
jgi:geranylgeranyl reductase family protein